MVKQKIQWRTHFIELIVVIIGITIAFSLNNWAQGRKDRRSEQEYLRSFLEDLDQDIAQLDSLISNSKKQMSSAGELFRILGQDDPLASIRHHHITSYYIVDYFHPKTGSFNSIVNSGNFDLIQ
ncbi:MAG: hypothetical protein KI790_19460, partial [Cyclobacteriaceae bacterium]|nr:hypothetical protein [Cyclobacteriaceae bacterium HetDA_MAG_MS6]